MRRPALRLLPLCMALAFSAQARGSTEGNWALCPVTDALPLFRPLEAPAQAAPDALLPTDVSALNLNVSEQQVTVLDGQVQMERGQQWLSTDQLTWRHDSGEFVTQGPVQFQDAGLRLVAQKAQGDQNADRIQLDGVRYQLNQTLGNGVAETVTIQGDQGQLTRASFSTCPPGQRQWEFRARQIKLDQAQAMGSARNVTLRLGGVPVLWLPYLRFPTDDRRRTGVLAPTLGYDDDSGFEFELPVYLNLAPNYDATLKPRLLSRRGLMLGGEFRYLTPRHSGIVDATWLPNDDLTGRDRGLASLQHRTVLGPQWFASANLNHVSDERYFEDFGNSLASSALTLLASDAGVYGRGLGWTASLVAQNWQIANLQVAPGSEPYRRLPSAQARWARPINRWLELGVASEAVRFEHESLAGGERVDLQPYVRVPLGGAAWFVTPEYSWRYTSYSLDRSLVPAGASRSPSRSLPVMSLDAGAFFEREFSHGDDGRYLQTLEPRLYYLNVPYRDQDGLPLFDTQPLTFSWPGLFRNNRFAGADRQGDAEQVTLALSSRILSSDDGRELLSAGLGRIHYFDAPEVTVPGAPPLSDDGSVWVAEASVALADGWSLSAAQQWDPDTESSTLSAVRSQWRVGDEGVVNAAYRRRAGQLEQTDVSFALPINAQWKLLGRWAYSLRDRETLEAMAGFEWKSCCVAVRLLGRDFVREFGGERRTAIYLELELNGVGEVGRNTARLLDDAILDYSR